MPSTDTKPELTAKASMAQPVSQPAVYANGLITDWKGPKMKWSWPVPADFLTYPWKDLKKTMKNLSGKALRDSNSVLSKYGAWGSVVVKALRF
jgi:hypothetical protein